MTLNLPHSLRQLYLHDTSMASSLLSSLPPNLETVEYKQVSHPDPTNDSWRGEDFFHLPRSLHTLYLHSATEVEDQHLALLPPHFKMFFTFKAPKLTKNALRFLPIHCNLGGHGYDAITQGYTPLSKRLAELPLQDPDPRVIGLPFDWK